MVATREPNEDQRTENVTKEALTQIAHLLLDSPLTDTNAQEPVSDTHYKMDACFSQTNMCMYTQCLVCFSCITVVGTV